VDRCRYGDCNVLLPDTGALCIACDLCDAFNEATAERKPDFVVLLASSTPSGTTHRSWFIFEMKAATAHPGRIIEQLQAGATVLQSNRRFAGLTRGSSVFPVVIRAGRGHTKTADIDRLQRHQIRFMGQRTAITLKRCGFNLGTLL
jgi:hypothetical protein